MMDPELPPLTVTPKPSGSPPAWAGTLDGAKKAFSRDKSGSCHSDKDANCDGTTQTGSSAPPQKLSKTLSPKAVQTAKAAGRDLAIDQCAANQLVDNYNFYQNQSPPVSTPDILAQYNNLQSGKDIGTNVLNTPICSSNVAYEAAKQYLKDAPPEITKEAVTGIIFGKILGKVLKPYNGPLAKPPSANPSEPPASSAPASSSAGGQSVGEPVSVATGEYVETWRDFHIPSDLVFDGARFMGSQLTLPKALIAPLGSHQISMFDEFFDLTSENKLTFYQADGKIIYFGRPFNFLASYNRSFPHLSLRAPWLKELELRDRNLVKYFRQYDDGIYRLEKLEDLNRNAIMLCRDEAGWLKHAETTDGLALAFSNDTNGRRTRIVLVGIDGSRLDLARYAYDARGRMTAAECAFGMSVRYYWHPERDLLLRWHNTTLRSETHFTYDDEGRVLHTRTNGIWNDDRFRYDPANRETTYLPSGEERSARRFRYDEYDNVTHETDALGNTLAHVFDSAGLETAFTDANGNTTTKAYDFQGNISRLVDAEGRATTYAWDPHGPLDMVIDGTGKIRRWENDPYGNTLAETCAEGHTTRYVRDDRGRLIRTTSPDGSEETRVYDIYGRLVVITDARGGLTRFSHDPFGRVVAQTDALGHVTRFEYAAGAGGFATPTAMIRADGVRLQRAFTDDGVLASVSDGEGRTWRYVFGAFDVLQTIEDPGGGKLAFAYDGEGRVTTVTNQNGVTYHLVRDAAGRVVAEEDFDGRRTDYTRDPGGRVVESRKPDGVRIQYGYDRTNKLTSIKSFAADATATDPPLDETYYWYDRRGLLIKASNQAALVEFERDGNGRITRETSNGREVECRLDARGNRIERRISRGAPGEGLVAIGRDPLGMVASIAIDNHAPLVFRRDPLGRETCRSSAKGFCLDQTWDAVGQLTRQRHGEAVERGYSWDHAGAPTAVDDGMWGLTRYTYDANGQVTKAEFGDGFMETFAYDPAKNVAGVALQGPRVDPVVSRLLAWQSSPGGAVLLSRGPAGETIALTHDVCGRVVERRVERRGFRPKTWRYVWDTHNRLARCDNPEGETWFYGYDPLGRRLTKVRKLSDKELAWTAQRHAALVPPAEREATKIWIWPVPPYGSSAADLRPPIIGTHFFWDGDAVAEEAPLRLDGTVDWDRATRWHYEPESFRPLAKQTAAGRLLPIVADHLGTPREMFEEQGRLAWAASYSTWGVVRDVQTTPEAANDDRRAVYPRGRGTSGNLALAPTADDAAFDCPSRFQGQWADKETSLFYNRFRQYDPLTAQYSSPDPIGLAGGLSLHGYVAGPTTAIDPLGLAQKALPAPQPMQALPPPAGSPAWMPGAPINAYSVPAGGMEVNMAMAPGQTRPGRWGTTDPIPDVSTVRERLAVTPQFKKEVAHVQKFRIPAGTQVQEGTVGPQTFGGVTYPGGGSQVQILTPGVTLEPVGPPTPIH